MGERVENQHQKLFDEIENRIPIITNTIKDSLNEIKNYYEVLKNEKFSEQPNETEERSIKRAEGIYDRTDEMLKRNNFSMKKALETIETLERMTDLFNGIVRNIEDEKGELVIRNNELIDSIIDLEKRKTKTLIEQHPRKKNALNGVFEDIKDEWNERRIKSKDLRKQSFQMATSSNTLFPDFKENKTIFVSGLPLTVNETVLFSHINKEFPSQVLTVHIPRNNKFDTAIAYINMATHDAAAQAISKMNRTLFQEKKINMFWALRDYKQRTQTETNLFVKGIKRDVDQNKLQQVFDKFGNTLSVKLSTNKMNESNGFGYVKYSSIEEAQKAISSQGEIKKEIGEDGFSVIKFEKQSKNARTNLCIGNIDCNVTEEQFVKYFETFGPIRTDPNGTKLFKYVFDQSHQKYKGFVNYQNVEDAEKAISSPKSGVLGSGDIIVAFYKSEEEKKRERKMQSLEIKANINGKYKDFNLYINTKKDETSEEEIRKIFVGCGEIYSLQIKYIDSKPTGFAYVCFTNQESTSKAMEKISEVGWGCQKFLTRNEKMSKTMYAPQMPFNFPMNYQMGFNPVYLQYITQFAPYVMNQMPTRDNNNYHEKKPRQRKQPKPQQQTHVVEKAPAPNAITEEMKNELGDELYDFILNLEKYDDGLAGRITGVVLESINYQELKNSLNSKTKELENIIAEVVENLKRIDA